MSNNNMITITLPVSRNGDKFKVPGWTPRTRDEWAEGAATWVTHPDRDVARAMVEYIDSLPENQPQGFGFLGTLDVGGEEYDVMRDRLGGFYATSRAGGKYLTFSTGRVGTRDWSEVLAAGKFTPRSGA